MRPLIEISLADVAIATALTFVALGASLPAQAETRLGGGGHRGGFHGAHGYGDRGFAGGYGQYRGYGGYARYGGYGGHCHGLWMLSPGAMCW
jgi:uncharacterized membrane protein